MKFSKKAVSEIVAYSLLIGISLAMAGSVYVWLKFYISNPLPTESCPSEISMIISDYCCKAECDPDLPAKTLNLTIQNRGNFNISGYVAKYNTQSAVSLGDIIGKNGFCIAGTSPPCSGKVAFLHPLPPSQVNSTLFKYSANDMIVQLEPYRNVTSKIGKSSELVYCEKAIVTQKISC